MSATGAEPWVDVFEAMRPRLVGIAYRMLGTVADAEDVVQDAFLRWLATDRGGIDRPEAWLTTVTTRLALDRLRSAQRRREDYVGPWLAEPVATAPGPEEAAELADSLTLGFLAVLDRLTPVERAVFLLADVFAVPFAEIAQTVGKSAAACRQIATRARARVRTERVAPPPCHDGTDRRVVEELLVAVANGDIAGVLDRLTPDARCVSDGGAARRAARRPVVGAERVARFLINTARKGYDQASVELVTINGSPGMVVSIDGEVDIAASFDIDPTRRVAAIWMVRNPEKLRRLDVTAPFR